jgi:hypothetical protein
MSRIFSRSSGKPTLVDPPEEARLDPHSFGNLALERGYITEADLEEALRVQKDQPKLEDILVEMGMLTPGQREELLVEQRILIAGKMSADEEIELCRLKKRNRILAIKAEFAEAKGDSESVAVSINRTLLAVENGG